MRLEVVEGMVVLHVGRVDVAPGKGEMGDLIKAIEYAYKPTFIVQSSEPKAHGRFMKKFLYWPVREVVLSWKRPVLEQRKMGI